MLYCTARGGDEDENDCAEGGRERKVSDNLLSYEQERKNDESEKGYKFCDKHVENIK